MAPKAWMWGLGLWATVACLCAGRLDYWGDEIGSLEGAALPVGSILTGRGADFHPPLYFLLLHAWQRLFGSGEYATRSLSVLIGAAVVWLTAVLGRHVGLGHSWRAAALLAVSPFWLLFCGMARYYSLSALVFIGAAVAFVRALCDPTNARWLQYAALVALAGYTNYLMAVALVVAHAAVVGLRYRSHALRWGASVLGAVVLLLPLCALVLAQTKGMLIWGERARFANHWRMVLLGAVYPLYVLAASETVLPWRVMLSIPLIGASSYLVVRSHRRDLLLMLGASIATGVMIVAVVARSLPLVYLPSRLLFLAPLWAILLAAGAERAGKVGIAAMAIVGLGYAGGITNLVRGRDYHNVTYLVPWRQIVRIIQEDTEGDKLVVTPEEYPLLHYGQGLRFQLVRPGEKVTKDLATKYPRVVWLVQRDRADRQRYGITGEAEAWLEANYDETRHLEFIRLSPMERKVRALLLGREPAAAAVSLTRFVRR